MENKTLGEICNGLAYIDWEHLASASLNRTVETNILRCFGRHKRFAVDNHPPDFDNSTSPSLPHVETKYVRAFGSTAVFFAQPDSLGRRKAVARTLGPFDIKGVQVGPLEESIVDLADRVNKEGYKHVFMDPLSLLLTRANHIGRRSFDMFRSAVFPVPQFISKMQTRIPELVRNTYDIATSIRIEIKIEEASDQSDDQSK